MEVIKMKKLYFYVFYFLFIIPILAYNGQVSYDWGIGVPNYNPNAIIHQGTIDISNLIFADFVGRSANEPNAQGYGTSASEVNWDDNWISNIGDANTNGDNLDGYWVQNNYPTLGWWDLGFETNRVIIFTSQDHGPYLSEGLEYRVYGSNTLWGELSEQATLLEVYLDGWRPHNPSEDVNGNGWCSDDITGVLQLPGYYRYIAIRGWDENFSEPEIDAVAGVIVPTPTPTVTPTPPPIPIDSIKTVLTLAIVFSLILFIKLFKS